MQKDILSLKVVQRKGLALVRRLCSSLGGLLPLAEPALPAGNGYPPCLLPGKAVELGSEGLVEILQLAVNDGETLAPSSHAHQT